MKHIFDLPGLGKVSSKDLSSERTVAIMLLMMFKYSFSTNEFTKRILQTKI